MPHELPPLPYAFDALEPVIDTLTMETHHGKHHKAYVDNLNNALKNYPELAAKPIEDLLREIASVPEQIRTAVVNNGGGHHNHTLFWGIMQKSLKQAADNVPTGRLADAINATFGSFAALKDVIKNNGLTQFGSGWTWLVVTADKQLEAIKLPNQDSPLMQGKTPILGIDVWEHAYYLKYKNLRAAYIDAWWEVANWTAIGELYNRAMA